MSLPSTVEAITIAKNGDFDVIEKTTNPFPQIQPNHIVIKSEYLGVNFIDTYFRTGLYPIKEFPAVIGSEASGIIVALPTDESILKDPDFKARAFTLGGKALITGLGAHASYLSVPWNRAFAIPDAIDTRTGSALLQALTCNTFMTEAYNVRAGDVILIHTVAGGLGLIMCQYAKHRGATVIGTTSTQAKADLAKAHGADHVILYPNENTVEKVLAITNGKGVAAIFDGVGKDTFEADLKMIARKGTIVAIGNASGIIPPFSPLKLVEKNVKFLRPTVHNYLVTGDETKHYTEEIFDLIAKGIIKINIFKEYPFTAAGVQQAQKDLTGGKTTGKLLIDISST